jgi:hypothetical protein
MDIPTNPQNIDQYEQTILTGLDTLAARVRNRMSSMPQPAQPEQIQSLLQDLNEETAQLHEYDPCVKYLLNAGKPQASQRLANMIPDVQGSINVCVEMYQSSVAHLPAMSNMKRQADQDLSHGMAELNQRQVDANEAFARQCLHRCIHCNYFLGDFYFTLAICPNCGRFPRT